MCEDIRCNSPSHKAAIESLHGETVSSLLQASTNLTTQITKTRGLGQPEHIPGWRKICSELHSYARSAFLFWRASGSPKHGPIYETMRTSRARFKQALRQCRKDRAKHTADKLAEQLINNNTRGFWQATNKMNTRNIKVPHPETVNGKIGNEEIAHMWRSYYQNLLNSSNGHAPNVNYNAIASGDKFVRFSPNNVHDAIVNLKNGKSAGHDSIQGEHLKFAHHSLTVYLSLLFNAIIVHNFMP